jgi:2-dehydro-3-deoxyphosphogalactonate aldolase
MSLLTPYMNVPLIAILRGVTNDEVVEVAGTLIEQGFTMIEVPLNSPNAIESIRRIAQAYGAKTLVGAGTVLTVEAVEVVASVGGKLMVSPNINVDVVKRAKKLGMVAIPGVATPTELFTAIHAGADAVKAFPADMFPPSTIQSWRAVIPAEYPIFAVGGIDSDNMAEYTACGISGFGIGSNLYKRGMHVADIKAVAKQFIHSISVK